MEKTTLSLSSRPQKLKRFVSSCPKIFMSRRVSVMSVIFQQSAADTPAKYKKEPWAASGINVDNDFEPLIHRSERQTNYCGSQGKVKKSWRTLSRDWRRPRRWKLSWHLIEILKPKCPVRRMVFHEITKTAIDQAWKQPVRLTISLCEHKRTADLDRLVGFTVLQYCGKSCFWIQQTCAECLPAIDGRTRTRAYAF